MNLFSSWKTTVAGIAVGVVGALVYLQVIDESTATIIIAALAAAGFALSRDNDKTSEKAGAAK